MWKRILWNAASCIVIDMTSHQECWGKHYVTDAFAALFSANKALESNNLAKIGFWHGNMNGNESLSSQDWNQIKFITCYVNSCLFLVRWKYFEKQNDSKWWKNKLLV